MYNLAKLLRDFLNKRIVWLCFSVLDTTAKNVTSNIMIIIKVQF